MSTLPKLLLLLILFNAPAHASEHVAPSAISVSPKPDGDWQVTYHFGYPVDGLRFMRGAGFLREENWRVETPGYKFERDGGAQLLVREKKAVAANTIRISFPVDTRFILRDYELFNRFSDGSLALFTGHFYVNPFGSKVPDPYSDGFVTELEIIPPDKHKVGIDGELSTRTLRWTDPSGDGTYAYIGATEPVDADGVTAIFDQGLPPWVASQAKQHIPALVEYYAQRMGPHATKAPLVLFSYEPEGGNPYGYNGGTRDDLIQIRVQGSGWQTKNDGAALELVRFFAHEAAHLWNSQAARSAPDAPPWIHEGSADAMAERALVALQLVDSNRFREYQELALNACHSGLAGKFALSETDDHRLNYPCGNVMAIWSELALEAVNPDFDLFTLWRHIISSGESPMYGQKDYFDAMGQLGVDEVTIAAMQAFLRSPQDSPATAIADGMAPLGIHIKRDDSAASVDAFYRASGGIVTALLSMDCQGPHGLNQVGNRFELVGMKGCRLAQAGMQVTHIEDVPIGADNFAAYHRAVKGCGSAGKVFIGNGQRQGITLPCPEQLPPLTGWWRILNV